MKKLINGTAHLIMDLNQWTTGIGSWNKKKPNGISLSISKELAGHEVCQNSFRKFGRESAEAGFFKQRDFET